MQKVSQKTANKKLHATEKHQETNIKTSSLFSDSVHINCCFCLFFVFFNHVLSGHTWQVEVCLNVSMMADRFYFSRGAKLETPQCETYRSAQEITVERFITFLHMRAFKYCPGRG